MEGMPDAAKLQMLSRQYRSAGRSQEADQLDAILENRVAGGSTQYERAFRVLSTLQQKVNAGQALSPEEQIEAQTQRALLSQTRMMIDPVTNRPVFSQPLQVPTAITVGIGGGGPGAPTVPVNTVPDPTGGGRKQLDAGSEKELQGMGDALSMALDLRKAFKPAYGGFGSDAIGNVAVEFGRRFGKDEAQRMGQFWEGYEQWVTDMRKDKYGLTLTGNELQQFERFRAKPSQSAAVIQNNLQRQVAIAERALGRRMTGLVSGGYNPSQIEGAVGWGAPRASNFVEPSPGPATADRKVKRTGKLDGRDVVEYEDGTVEVR